MASTHTHAFPKLKSILRCPPPFSPTPFPFSASFFSVYLTPTSSTSAVNSAVLIREVDSPTLKSPHVHFPPTPTLISMLSAAHSPNTYDRAPTSVSPNPLDMPPWADSVYSPTTDAFKLNATVDEDSKCKSETVPFVFLRLGPYHSSSPTTSEFEIRLLEDPRSPKANDPLRPRTNTTSQPRPKRKPQTIPVSPLAPTTLPPSDRPLSSSHTCTKPNNTHCHCPNIRFTDHLHPNPLHPHSPTTSLCKSLTSYPSSPYPSAPVGPSSPSFPSDSELGATGSALGQKPTCRRALSLDDMKLSWRGERGRCSGRGGRGKGSAAVQLGVPVPALVAAKLQLGHEGGFKSIPSPSRQRFSVSAKDEDIVGKGEGKNKPTRTATGRKILSPLELDNSFSAFLAGTTITTTITTTTTVQMTGTNGDSSYDTNTRSTTSLDNPPPYSETPITGAEITLGFTPTGSAPESPVGVGYPAKTSSASPKSFIVDENTCHCSQRQKREQELDRIENAKLTKAFWESISLAGSDGLEEDSMTSPLEEDPREERKEDRYIQPSYERRFRRWPGSPRTVSSDFGEEDYESSDDDDDGDINESATESGLCENQEWGRVGRRRSRRIGRRTSVGVSSSSSIEDFTRSLSYSTLTLLPSSARSGIEQEDLESGDDDDGQINIVFATRDGVLWSPGLPRRPHSRPHYYQSKSITTTATTTTTTSDMPDDINYDITYQGSDVWRQYKEEGAGRDENGSVYRRKEEDHQATSSLPPLRPIEESKLIAPIQPPPPTKKLEISGLKSRVRDRNPGMRLMINDDAHEDVDEERWSIQGLKSPDLGAGRPMRFVSTTNTFSNGSFRDVGTRASPIPTTKRMPRSVVASPSPNDPTAAFPTFSFALSQYLEDGRLEGNTRVQDDPNTGATRTGTITVSVSTNTTTTIDLATEDGQEDVPFSPPSLKYPPRARLTVVTGDGIQLKHRNTAR